MRLLQLVSGRLLSGQPVVAPGWDTLIRFLLSLAPVFHSLSQKTFWFCHQHWSMSRDLPRALAFIALLFYLSNIEIKPSLWNHHPEHVTKSYSKCPSIKRNQEQFLKYIWKTWRAFFLCSMRLFKDAELAQEICNKIHCKIIYFFNQKAKPSWIVLWHTKVHKSKDTNIMGAWMS